MDTTRSAAWSALLRVHAALVPMLDRELQATHGLPLTWYDVLLELNAAPGRRATMGALGEAVVISRSRVSRVVDELVRAGLVVREPNPHDRRSAYATVTDLGRRRLRAAAPTYLSGIERHFTSKLSAREADIIAKAFGRILTDLDEGARAQPADRPPGRRTAGQHAGAASQR